MDLEVFKLSNLIILLSLVLFDGACEGLIYRDHVFHENHVKGGILYIGNNLDWLQEDSAHLRRYGFSSILLEIDNSTDLERFFTGNFSTPPFLKDSTNTSIILVCSQDAALHDSNSSSLINLLKNIPDGKKEKENFRISQFGRLSSIIIKLRNNFIDKLHYGSTFDSTTFSETDVTSMCDSMKWIGGQLNLLGLSFGFATSISNLGYVHLIPERGEQKAPKNLITLLLLDGDIYNIRDKEAAYHYDKFSQSFDDLYKNFIRIMKQTSYTFNTEVIIKAKWFFSGGVKPKDVSPFLHKYGQIISQFIYTWGHLSGRGITFSEIPEHIGDLDTWLNYTVSYSSRSSVYKPVIRYTDTYQERGNQFIPTHTLFPALCEKYDELIVEIVQPRFMGPWEWGKNVEELMWRQGEFGKFLSQLMNGSCNSQISVRMSMTDNGYNEWNQDAGYFADQVLNQTKQAALTSPGYLKSILFSPFTTCDDVFNKFEKFAKNYTKKWKLTNNSIGIFGHCLNLAGEQLPATRAMFGSPIRLGFITIMKDYWGLDLPSNVKLLTEQSLELEKLVSNQDEILIARDWQRNSLSRDRNCYGYKVYVTTAINLGFLFGYKVYPAAPDITCRQDCKDAVWTPYISDFKFSLVDELTSNANSSFNEICVMIDAEVPSSMIQFDRSLSGVSLNISQSIFQDMQAKQLAALLQLIHLRFDRIEIILDCGDPNNCLPMVKLFQEAVSILEELVGRESFNRLKYYFNSNLFKINSSELVSHLKSSKSGSVQGIHFELSDTTDFEAIKSSVDTLKKGGKSFGVAFDIGQMENLTSLLTEEVVPLCDYMILNVRILDVLAVMSRLSSSMDKTSNAYPSEIYETMNDRLKQFESSFHELFDILRVYRFQFEQVNQNVTVILRLRWPTFTRRAEGDSREGFNLNYPHPPPDGFLWYPQPQYLRIWKFIQEYSSTFNFPIFINQAFDDEESDAPEKDYEKYFEERFGITEGLKYGYGWWTIHNYSDVGNLSSISEKQADYLGFPTDRPVKETVAQKEPSGDDNFYKMISIGVAVGVIAFMALVILSVLIGLRGRYTLITKQEILEFKYGKVPALENEDKEELCIFGVRYDKEKYEIRKEAFSKDLSCIIGEGNFGIVYKMEMARFNGEVAVKMPKETDTNSAQSTLRSLLHEIKIMSYVGEHRNILTLLGAYTKEIHKGAVWVVTEYCERGCLLKHLRKAKEDKSCDLTDELYRYCQEIACGMAYLAEKRVIHGDLSARNVLLDKDSTCKISDFGLSRMLKERYSAYVKETKEPLPWAWLAIESLQDLKFTFKSDIWSMGITFWEVFTLGKQPYSGLTWDLEFSGKLVNGLRLPKPDEVDDETYTAIRNCWELEPDSRPDAPDLLNFFQKRRDKLYQDLSEISAHPPSRYVNCR